MISPDFKRKSDAEVASLPYPALSSETEEDVSPPAAKKARSGFVLKALKESYKQQHTNDDVHLSVDICPVFKAIWDTPQVQRLRYLKQLGTADFTYTTLNHTRFTHSLGVAHLAESMTRHLQTTQPSLQITNKDTLCIKLAALCHDLGHGPFSHVYMSSGHKVALRRHLERNPHLLKHYQGMPEVDDDWEHEHASIMMIDAALKSLGLAIDTTNLDKPLKQIGDGIQADTMRVFGHDDPDSKPHADDILTSRDWIFIMECIIGKPIGLYGKPIGLSAKRMAPPAQPIETDMSGYVGRPYRRQEFLYDILANRHSGLDVDKLDYFARDERHAFGGAGEVHRRMIDEAVVAWGTCPNPSECFRCRYSQNEEDKKHVMICYPEKTIFTAMKVFLKRFELHTDIYTHDKTVAVASMVCDFLTQADPFFLIPTGQRNADGSFRASDGVPKALPISRAMLDEFAYLRLRDGVMDQIIAKTDDHRLVPAQNIIERIQRHDLYKCVKKKELNLDNIEHEKVWAMTEEEIKQEFLDINAFHADASGQRIVLEEDDFIIEKNRIHHGKGKQNPVLLMRFLPEDERKKKLKLAVDELPLAVELRDDQLPGNTPRAFQRQYIRVFCRGNDAKADLLKHVFEEWSSKLEEESQFEVTAEMGGESDVEGESEPIMLTQEADEY